MDKDRIKGKLEDIGGRMERQAGEWTGDERAQAEGALHQAKGKMKDASGRMKDAARDAADELKGNKVRSENDQDEIDREKKDAA